MKKILVILPNNLGDVIMALPVLAGLKAADPQTHITFFVERGFEAGLVNSPFCDRIFLFDRKSVRDRSRTADWRGAAAEVKQAIAEHISEKFNRVINLSQHPYVSYIVTLLGCGDSAGRRFLRDGNHALPDAWSQYLYAIPFARSCNDLHATDVYTRIAGPFPAGKGGGLRVTDDEKSTAAAFLSENGMQPDGRTLLVLQPGAAYAAKRWPPEHFAALGSMLIANGYGLVITGAPAESTIARTLGEAVGRPSLVTAGKLSFRETIALLPFTKGCVTGDTAIMHAAAALGVRTYALFGPTNPVETGPYGPGHCVLYGKCAKRPCFGMNCNNALCMKSIAPETVFGVIQGPSIGAAGCDVYATASRPDGSIRLEPIGAGSPPLFDPAAAALARAIVTGAKPDAPVEAVRRDAEEFIGRLDRMAAALADFLETRSIDAISRYERIHGEPNAAAGIAVFCTALLNIRLNGIPLLDPVGGVRESLSVCRELAGSLRHATSGR
jgi:ADP-heptose:LPS heptosyltransferase